MSKTIDQKVVQMEFDNQNFERNAKETMSTLDKLKAALKFDGANKGAEELSKGIKSVGTDFSQCEIMATRAGFHIQDVWLKLSNVLEYQIARKIINLGENMVKSLTLDQVTAGFNEYELKMGSIQTIMAGTGEKLEVVNKYLNELNEYSDKTIYSFSDMTQNIGKFTNAGVKLHDAVAAIQGVANVAAVSGANAQEASRAMYNFAQALSAGYVKLIDWKSIENANMATVEFKDTLLQTAVAMKKVESKGNGMYKVLSKNAQGKTMDGLVSSTKNFNDSLAYQWMTTDVLTQALEIYSKDVRTLTEDEKKNYENKLKGLGFSQQQIEQFEELGIKATKAASEVKTFSQLMDTIKESIGSGWAMSFEHIIGNFNEAKELFTRINDAVGVVIAQIDNKRNAMLENWKHMSIGGREDLIEAFANLGKALGEWIVPIKKVFDELFGTLDSRKLANIVKTFKDWTESIRLNKEQQENLRITLHYLLTPVKLLIEIVKALIKMIPPLLRLGSDIIQMMIGIGGILARLLRQQILKHTKQINNALGTIKKALTTVANTIKGVVVAAFDYFGRILKDSNSWLNKTINLLKVLGAITLAGLRTAFNSLANFKLSNITDGLDKMKNRLKDMSENSKVIKFFIETFEELKEALHVVGVAFGVFFDGLAERVSKTETFGDFLQALWDSLKDGYEFLKEFIESKFFKDGPGLFETIKNAFSDFISVLEGGMDKIPWAKLILIAFTLALGSCIINLITAISKFGGLAGALKETVFIFNEAIKTFTGLRSKLIALKEVGILLTGVTLSLVALAWVEHEYGNLTKVATILGILAGGLMIFAEAMLWINAKNALNPAALGSLLLSIGALVAGTSLLVAAAAALKEMSLSFKETLPYLKTLGVIMAGMLAAMLLLTAFGKDHKVFAAGAKTVLAYAGSVYMLAKALQSLSEIQFPRINSLLKVLAAVFAGFTLVSIASSGFVKMSKTSGFIFDGSSGTLKVLAFAASLKLIAMALTEFSTLNLSESANKIIDMVMDLAKFFGTLVAATIVLVHIFGKEKMQFTKLQKDTNSLRSLINSFSVSLLAIASSFFIISKAFETLRNNLQTGKDWAVFGGTLAIFAVLIVGLGHVFKSVSKASNTLKDKNALIKFAISVTALSVALIPLALVLDLLAGVAKENSIRDLAIAATVIAGVGILMKELMKAGGQLKLTSFKSILAIFGSFAILIGVLAGLTLMIDNYGVEMIGAMAVMGIVGFGMAQLIEDLSKMKVENIKMGPYITVASSLVALAGVLVGLTFLIDGEGAKVIGALGLLAGIAGVLVLTILAFSAIEKKVGSVGKIMQPLITIVGSMVVLSGVLAGLALIIEKHGESIKQALIDMGLIGLGIVALYAAFAVIDKYSTGSNWASLLSLAAVVISIAGALFILSNVPWDKLKDAALAIGMVLGAFALFAAVLGVLNTILPASGAILDAFTFALAAFVAAIGLVIAAASLFANAVANIINAITELGKNGDKVSAGLKKVEDAVVRSIENISTALMKAGPKLAKGAEAIMIGISNGIYKSAPIIAAAIAQVGAILTPAISSAIVEIGKALGQGLQYLLEGILNSALNFFDAGLNLSKKLAEGFAGGEGAVAAVGQALISALLNILLGPLASFFNAGSLIKSAFLKGATPSSGEMKYLEESYSATTAGMMNGVMIGTQKSISKTQQVAKNEASKIPPSVISEINKAADGGSKAAAKMGDKISNALYAGWSDTGKWYQTTVAPYFNNFKNDLGEKGLYGAAKDAAKGIYDNFKGYIFDYMPGGIDDLTNAFKDVTAAAEDSVPAFNGAGDAAEEAGSKAKKGAKSAKEAADEVSSFVEKMEGSFNIFDEFDLGLDEENPLTSDKLISNMRSNVDGMVQWSHEMKSISDKVAQGLYKKLADLGPQGYKYVHAFAQMTEEQLSQVNQLYATSLVIPTSVTAEIYQGMNLAAGNAYTGFVNGLHIEEFQTLGVNLATGFLTGLTDPAGLDTHSPSKKTYAIGTYATQGLSNGLKDPSAKEGLYYTISNMCREIIQKFRLGLSAEDFKDIGQQILRGLNNGITSKNPDVLKSVSNLCEAIEHKARNVLQINSPSKVFAEIGSGIPEGMAKGITDNIDIVESSTQRMADATVDNMRDAIATIQAVVDSDMDVEPVIRPVVDLSNVQNGGNMINSLLGPSFMSGVNVPQASFMQTSQLISNTDNTNVVDAVVALQEDVVSLKDAMTNIKMVLDTGTMVGAMTPAIDQQLGRNMIYAGRGI